MFGFFFLSYQGRLERFFSWTPPVQIRFIIGVVISLLVSVIIETSVLFLPSYDVAKKYATTAKLPIQSTESCV